MWTRILLPCLLLLPELAHARNAKWFLKGAGNVDIAGQVDVPLYRGVVGDHLPMVEVVREVDGKPRSALAVVDLGRGWTRVGRELAVELGIRGEAEDLFGQWAQVATIDALKVGDVTIRDMRVQVVDGDDFVLGLGALDDLAYAILPSEGVVRLVPASEGMALVQSVGDVMPLYRQTAGKFTHDGDKVWGNGIAFSTDGSISGRDGRVGLDSARAVTRVTSVYKGVDERTRQGVPSYRGRGRIGSIELAESWVHRDDALIDPAVGYVGSFGYDQLYSVDIALSPADEVLAIAKAADVKYTSTVQRVLELATERHAAAGLAKEEEESTPRPPRMQFEGEPTPEELEGDPGDPRVASLEQNLALALWQAGKLDDAMPHFLKAAEAGGDRCRSRMELGLKRLAWSGSMQEQQFIVELIQQPLREAGDLWDRWESLSPEQRMAARSGGELPEGTFRIPQDRRCLTAWGTLMAAYVAQGNTAASSAIYTDHYGKDPLVGFAQGISLLSQGQARTAEIPIREALSFDDIAESGDFKLGLGRAYAEQEKAEPTEAVVDEIPGLDIDHPLTAALMAVNWGRMLGGEAGAEKMARRLVKQDPFWIPAQLLALHLELEEADPVQLGAELVRQRRRFAGSVALEVHSAVYTALNDDPAAARKALRKLQRERPPTPDLFAAMALVAHIRGKPERVQEALTELRLRYPTIPVGDLGFPAPPEEVAEK